MKSIRSWYLAVVATGILLWAFSVRNPKNVVSAQARTPVTMYRFYSGKDGLAHVEKIEVKNFDSKGVASLLATTTGAEIHTSKPDAPGADFGPYHVGPRRQYIFNLAGHEEIEFSGGGRITVNPGDIELIEDLAPSKGHRNRNLGPGVRVNLWVPIADQNVVRGPIPK